jgi:hypothetical protein
MGQFAEQQIIRESYADERLIVSDRYDVLPNK